jgi:uncharacterized spore protein YtfJ
MDIRQMLQNLAESVSAGASVKNVYGEPVVVGNRTVLPAARVRYAFGGGGGGEASRGGGGGRVSVRPCGALEITPEGARFIPFGGQRRLCAAFASGFPDWCGRGGLARHRPHRSSEARRGSGVAP